MLAAISHWLIPRYSNNHKARLLHTSSLVAVILLLVTLQVGLVVFPKTGVRVLGYAANISPEEVIRLTNVKRAENGLPPVRQSAALTNAALAKGTDMLNKDYWAHVAPDGTQPWFFFTQAGYSYKYAGENLARDFSNPQSAVDAWMASTSHRENLLSGKYNDVGVAVVEGDLAGVDTTIIVQLFGTVAGASTVAVAPAAAAQPTAVPTVVPTATPVPTVVPTPAVTTSPELVVQTSQPVAEVVSRKLSPFDTTKAVSAFTIVSLLGVMAVDGYVVTRRRIPRPGGRIFAHLAFLGMVLAIVLIAKVGAIL